MNNTDIKSDAGIKSLGSAIILRAVSDYTNALIYEKKRIIVECEDFFRSGWYSTLIGDGIEGEEMIKRLKNGVNEFMDLSWDTVDRKFISKKIEPEYMAFQCPICTGNVYSKYCAIGWKMVSGKRDNRYGIRIKCHSCETFTTFECPKPEQIATE